MSSKSPTEEHAAKPAVDTGSPSTQDTDMSNVQTTETSSKQEEKDKSVSTVDTSKESNGTKAGSLGAPSSPEPAKRRDSDVNMEEPVEAPQRQIEEDSDYDQDEKLNRTNPNLKTINRKRTRMVMLTWTKNPRIDFFFSYICIYMYLNIFNLFSDSVSIDNFS